MSQSLVCCYLHLIFSTKERRQLLVSGIQDRLWPYMGGIARENGMQALEVGGREDHGHLLLSMPAALTIAKGVQLIKGGSSKWLNDTFFSQRDFHWQNGYAVFSVSPPSIDSVREYIQQQEAHHHTHTFKEEVLAFLQRYQIPYDERYLWD